MTIHILHVEDADEKAELVARAVQHVADRLGYAVRITRVASIEELISTDHGTVHAAIADWQLPTTRSGPTVDGAGASALSWAQIRQLPVLVWSGCYPPLWYRDTYPTRWSTAVDLRGDLEWLFDRVVTASHERHGLAS